MNICSSGPPDKFRSKVMSIFFIMSVYYGVSIVDGPYNPSLHILPDVPTFTYVINMIPVDLSRFVKVVGVADFAHHVLTHTFRGVMACVFLKLSDYGIDKLYQED